MKMGQKIIKPLEHIQVGTDLGVGLSIRIIFEIIETLELLSDFKHAFKHSRLNKLVISMFY